MGDRWVIASSRGKRRASEGGPTDLRAYVQLWRVGPGGEDSSGAEARSSCFLMSELKLRPPKE